ncbi:NACHT domain-containing protein [Streptomyces tricolor]|nr:NACHT domain-containing protein [Streptomyces tricolor]
MEAALGGATRVLLRGEAGSGKTTLLRWLAVTAARGAFTGELAAWNGLTPVFVKLREYSGRALPVPEAMLDSVAGQITGVMPKAWVERQLVDGRALLLIDGVDELLDGERRGGTGVAAGAAGRLRRGADRRHLASGRRACRLAAPRGVHGAAPGPDDRARPGGLRTAVAPGGTGAGRGPALPGGGTPALRAVVADEPQGPPAPPVPGGYAPAGGDAVRDAPQSGQPAPRDRMELYRNALHTLVHERDADRNVPSAVDSRLSLNDKLVLLRDLAWRLSDNNRSEIAREQAAVHVGKKLAGMRHLDGQDGGKVLEQLRDRSACSAPPPRTAWTSSTGPSRSTWPPRRRRRRTGSGTWSGGGGPTWTRGARPSSWPRATPTAPSGEELLGGVLDRARQEPPVRPEAAAAGGGLPGDGAGGLGGLAGRLEEAVSALLPPRRRTDPPALAAVGTSLLRETPRAPWRS